MSLKGSRDGLRVVVTDAGSPDEVLRSLKEQLERRGEDFFRGARTVLEMPCSPLDMELVGALSDVLDEAGMLLTSIVATEARQTRGAAPPARGAPATPDTALLVERTLRSGQRIVHDGPVVVLGDVNPGAEVVSGGSVVVWGRLRGTVEAGLADGEAVVCALDLSPTQLRIGSTLARAPEEPNRTPLPEVAREEEGRIVVEPWTAADPRAR